MPRIAAASLVLSCLLPTAATAEPDPGAATVALGAARCTRGGTCTLTATITRPTGGAAASLVVQRREDDGTWRTYESSSVPASGPRIVRVSAGRYRARLRLPAHELHPSATTPWRTWTHGTIRSSSGTWPIAPRNQQHAIRNAFLDGRAASYHHGVDIFVDDAHPEPGAARWASHRVYAVRAGTTRFQPYFAPERATDCTQNVTAVGTQRYFHVVPTVPPGRYVRAGQQVGWSCRNRWHIHLTNDVAGVPTNPLQPGATILRPYVDDTPPRVLAISAWSPCDGRWKPWSPARDIPVASGIAPCGHRLDAGRVRGLVDVRFRTLELGPRFADYDAVPWQVASLQPYRASITVDRLDAAGRRRIRVLAREVFRAGSLANQPALTTHWAPGHRTWKPMWQCARPGLRTRRKCEGAHWFRAFATTQGERYWDTTHERNGRYRVVVHVWDPSGNHASARLELGVRN